MAEISYDALRKIQMQERNFGALSSLDEDFYERYNLWISEQKRLLHTEFSIETLKAFENAKKIIEEISAKREQKIVLKALKDLRSNSIDSAGLSKEEKSFYLKMLTDARDFEQSVVLFTEKKQELRKTDMKDELKPVEKSVSEKLATIRILVSMGRFVAPDGATYGPFEPSQIVSIDREIAEILVRKGAAKDAEVLDEIERMDSSSLPETKGGLPDTVIIN
ncbi:MAG TPA: hypothetical protein VJI13_01145 [Candidatus Norongarragalinales archaeon]|nr:hypothetical protein [Candidatus Norongarragalinales archaeon]